MKKINYPSDINKELFKKNQNNLLAKYGLPKHVLYCKKCVISNQRPNSIIEYNHNINTKKKTINFDDDGICDACNFAAKKNNVINWKDRELELAELCNKFRKNDGSYDCLIPGSGGKDSFFTSHILKTKFNMNPLTVTWAPHIYTDWGWKNFQKWIHAGHDNYLMTPNGRVHRLLTRLATEILFHPFQPFFFGQKNIAPRMATEMNIPLVFYGENEAEYGNPIADTMVAKRDWEYFTSKDQTKVTLSGVTITDLKKYFGLSSNDLQPYMPISPDLMAKKNVEVHYLGYYLKWHPQSCYYYAVEHGGFEASPERSIGSYSKYSSIDDKIDDLHFYTTGMKFGIGRASYEASQEIRSGDIDREEGVALVKRFDLEYPGRFLEELLEYLSIDEKTFPIASKMFEKGKMDKEYFDKLTDRFRSPHLWFFENNSWHLRYTLD